jgi:hypothetical protein
MNIWEMTAVFFGILSVIGASLFVICFNIQIYMRNRRVEQKARIEFLKTVANSEKEPNKRASLEVVVEEERKKKKPKIKKRNNEKRTKK